MGRLRFGRGLWIVVTIFSFAFLPACGGHKPPGASPFAARITLNPSTTYSMQAGTVIVFTATAQNAANSSIRTTFTFASSNPGVVDVAPNGAACAGTWNAPLYTVCSPGGIGTAEVTAESGGTTSAPTLVFVHPFISNIQVSIIPPVNSPPPACPTQTELPAACTLPFKATNSCLSQNQILNLQANAFDSQGTDITASVGPFVWSQGNADVATLTPIVTNNNYNFPTNQANASANTPGQTQVIASASGVSSQPFDFETCPVQCIALELNVSGSQSSNLTNFVVNKGTSETVTAYAVDVQGCIVPKPPLTWISSEPAALTAGSSTSGCSTTSTTCTIATTQPGVAAISASCTPPTCNVGYPLNISGVPAPYVPQPVYPVTAISGLVTGTAAATTVLATSQDCYSNIQCEVGLYNVSTSTNLPGGASPLPTPPNSLMFDLPGDRAYVGSQFGAVTVSPRSIGSSTSPFSSLPASGTPMGLVTGKVIGVSHNGAQAIFSDTVSTPNQVYLVGASSSALPLNINSATAAAFSPDGLKTFILGDGGNTLYIYSALQYLEPPIALPSPASSIVFNSTGSFALLSGGSSAGTLAALQHLRQFCSNAASVGRGHSRSAHLPEDGPRRQRPHGHPDHPALQTQGLDFFFGVDNTGIDIIATTSSLAPLTTLCPQQITLAQTPQNATFLPIHIDLNVGSFTPINFFLSPDSTKAYIVASDSSGVLVYNFDTGSTSAIPLVNNATPLSADMTVDGSLIYVAGSDGMLHEVNTDLSLDRMEVTFHHSQTLPTASATPVPTAP